MTNTLVVGRQPRRRFSAAATAASVTGKLTAGITGRRLPEDHRGGVLGLAERLRGERRGHDDAHRAAAGESPKAASRSSICRSSQVPASGIWHIRTREEKGQSRRLPYRPQSTQPLRCLPAPAAENGRLRLSWDAAQAGGQKRGGGAL